MTDTPHAAAVRALVSTAAGDTDERDGIYMQIGMSEPQMRFVDSILDVAVWLLGEAGAVHLVREYADYLDRPTLFLVPGR